MNMRGFEAGLLQSLDHLILRQVKRQQLCISNAEASVREVDSLLLGLDAAEADELGQLSSSSHEGVRAVAEAVAKDTVRRRGVARQRLLTQMQAQDTKSMQGSAMGGVGLAHFRDVIWVLSSTAATALQPSTWSWLLARLYGSVRAHR